MYNFKNGIYKKYEQLQSFALMSQFQSAITILVDNFKTVMVLSDSEPFKNPTDNQELLSFNFAAMISSIFFLEL